MNKIFSQGINTSAICIQRLILGISHNTEIRCRKTSQKQSVLQKIQPLNQVAEHEYKVNQQNLEVSSVIKLCLFSKRYMVARDTPSSLAAVETCQSATPTPAAVHHARSVPECFSGCDGHHCAWKIELRLIQHHSI